MFRTFYLRQNDESRKENENKENQLEYEWMCIIRKHKVREKELRKTVLLQLIIKL